MTDRMGKTITSAVIMFFSGVRRISFLIIQELMKRNFKRSGKELSGLFYLWNNMEVAK